MKNGDGRQLHGSSGCKPAGRPHLKKSGVARHSHSARDHVKSRSIENAKRLGALRLGEHVPRHERNTATRVVWLQARGAALRFAVVNASPTARGPKLGTCPNGWSEDTGVAKPMLLTMLMVFAQQCAACSGCAAHRMAQTQEIEGLACVAARTHTQQLRSSGKGEAGEGANSHV